MADDDEQQNGTTTPHWVSRRKEEHKFSKWWRPAMGWMYMAVCIFDFIIFPALWSLHLGYLNQPVTQWVPLTLQATGFFHMAMGAVLGIAAWNRTVEKLNDKI
jgi:Holin of 3TMs, for gene-transfer release